MKRSIIITLYKIAFRLNSWRQLLFHPLILGVKIMLVRGDEVLLVKHTYQPGWYFPGGGVKWGETLAEAARREAWEEVGATIDEMAFLGIYSTTSTSKTEHIAVFVSHAFTITNKPDYEIESWDFYPMANPPEGISNGNRRRIEEYLLQKQPDARLW